MAKCYKCGREVQAASVDTIIKNIRALGDSLKLTVLAPIVRDRKGEFKDVLANLKKRGFSKVNILSLIHI